MPFLFAAILLGLASPAEARKPLPVPFVVSTEVSGEAPNWTVAVGVRANVRLEGVTVSVAAPDGVVVAPSEAAVGEVAYGETPVREFAVTGLDSQPLIVRARVVATEVGGVATTRIQSVALGSLPAPVPEPPPPVETPPLEPAPAEPASSSCGCESSTAGGLESMPWLLALLGRRARPT